MEWKNVSAEGNSTGKGPEVGNSMVHLKQEDTNPEWMEQKERGDYGLESGALHLLPEGTAFFFCLCFFFLSVAAQGFSLVARSGGDSLVVLGLLNAVASLVVEHGLEGAQAQQLQPMGSVLVVRGLNCPTACRIFWDQEAGEFLTCGPPGKFQGLCLRLEKTFPDKMTSSQDEVLHLPPPTLQARGNGPGNLGHRGLEGPTLAPW